VDSGDFLSQTVEDSPWLKDRTTAYALGRIVTENRKRIEMIKRKG
jgi:hypothetical protein